MLTHLISLCSIQSTGFSLPTSDMPDWYVYAPLRMLISMRSPTFINVYCKMSGHLFQIGNVPSWVLY